MIPGAAFLFNDVLIKNRSDSIGLAAQIGLVCAEGIPHTRSGIFFSLGETS